MSSLSRTALAGLLALGVALPASSLLGCAKKSEPVAAQPGSKFTTTLGKVTLLRRDTGVSREDDSLTYMLRVTNGMAGDATVDRVEFSFGIGDRELGTGTAAPALKVAAGDTGKVQLGGTWEWRQQSDMPDGQAWVRGTVYWTGPHQARTTTFEHVKDYEESQ